MVVLAIFGAVSARGGIRIFGVHKKGIFQYKHIRGSIFNETKIGLVKFSKRVREWQDDFLTSTNGVRAVSVPVSGFTSI